MSNLNERKALVRKLTAASVVLFDNIELVQDTYLPAVEYLEQAMVGLTDVVERLVIDAYRELGEHIARPRISYESNQQAFSVEDLTKLEEIIEELGSLYEAESHSRAIWQAADHISTAINTIILIDRLNLEPEGDLKNPWAVLAETQGE